MVDELAEEGEPGGYEWVIELIGPRVGQASREFDEQVVRGRESLQVLEQHAEPAFGVSGLLDRDRAPARLTVRVLPRHLSCPPFGGAEGRTPVPTRAPTGRMVKLAFMVDAC